MIAADQPTPPFGPDRRYWRRRANRQVRKARRIRAVVRLLGVAAVHLAVAGVLAMAAARCWSHLTTSPSLAVRRLVVEGTQRTTAGAVRASLAPLIGRNLLALELAEAERLLRPDPWIARASIHRVFPHTLRVVVTERVPTAVALLGGVATAVDAEGTAIGPCGPGLADDLPVLTGLDALDPEQRPGALRTGVEAVRRLRGAEASFAETVSEIDLSRPDRVAVLTSVQGPRILLDPRRIERNLGHYLALRPELDRRVGPSDYVDLRWSGRISLLPTSLPEPVLERR